METGGGRWVPIDEYARRKGISKGTVYKAIHRGELIKRKLGGTIEVFISGAESAMFEKVDIPKPKKGSEVMEMDFELPSGGDEFSLAAQSLQTLMSMQKEVLAEKQRKFLEWESELANREEKLMRLEGEIAERDKKIAEKNAEIRNLRQSILRAEETSFRLEQDLREIRETIMQFNELTVGKDRDWERVTALLDDKDRVIEAKDRIIQGMESSVGQNDIALRNSERVIEELKRTLRRTRQMLDEKETALKAISADPADLDGKIAARDQKIADMKSLTDSLEKQLKVEAKSGRLTGFEQDTGEVTSMIQDQLEYLMAAQSAQAESGDDSKPAEIELEKNPDGD